MNPLYLNILTDPNQVRVKHHFYQIVPVAPVFPLFPLNSHMSADSKTYRRILRQLNFAADVRVRGLRNNTSLQTPSESTSQISPKPPPVGASRCSSWLRIGTPPQSLSVEVQGSPGWRQRRECVFGSSFRTPAPGVHWVANRDELTSPRGRGYRSLWVV